MYEQADIAGPSYPSHLSRRASDSFEARPSRTNGFRMASSPVTGPSYSNWSQETITHSKSTSGSTDKSTGYSDESEEDYGTQTFPTKREPRTPPPPFLHTRHSMSTVKQEDANETLAYTSLPSSPISETPVSPTPPIYDDIGHHPSQSQLHSAPFSLWDYLREELLATDFDSHQELKWERVSNFLSIPLAVEKVSSQYLFISMPLLIMAVDARLRIHSLLRFLPPHLYNTSYPMCLSYL